MIKIFLGIIRNKFSFGIALISTIMIMNGCAALSSIKPEESPKMYKISVDGYKKREGLNVTKDAKIYVYKNNQASNILLEKEVIAKEKAMFRIKGYALVDKPEDADYLLAAVYGIGSEIPVIYSSTTSTSGGGSKYELNVFTGQFEKVPDVNVSTRTTTSTEMVYPRYLRLILYDAKSFIVSKAPEPVWIGDVRSTGSSSDLRKVIDYLIVAGFTCFGEDMKEQKKGTIQETDERVKRLREEISYEESSDSYEVPSVDMSGNWSGSWISGNGIERGNLSMSLIQNESNLSGTVIINGSPCFSAGNISGIVSRNNMASAILSGDLRIDFSGTMVGNNINGSYAVINGGACTGDSGTWMVSK